MIEAEVRSLLTKEQYGRILSYLQEHTKFIEEDDQVTYYFEGPADVRLQQTKTSTKLWYKKGKLHEPAREETEVIFKRDDFKKVVHIFEAWGHPISIPWYRKRYTFAWDDVSVMLDYTRGYGYILELEKKVEPKEVDVTVTRLRKMLASLQLEELSREAFDKKYYEYKNNWRQLLNEDPEMSEL